MARKLFDHAVGADVHVVVESADDGTFDVKVSYPVSKLHAPVTALLQKVTAKIPFIQSRVPLIVNGLFSQLGVSLEPSAPAAAVPSDSGPAAHEAAPIEPAAPQA